MQIVIETPTFIKSAFDAKMTEGERFTAIDFIAANPEKGDIIVAGHGLRKVRVAGKGKGKSGGYRIIYYYQDENSNIKLYFVFAKNQQSNLTDAQLTKLVKVLEGE